MASFEGIAGGLLTGLGVGMVAQAAQRRQDALELVRQLREDRQLKEEREFQLTRDKTRREFDLTRDKAEHERTLERDKSLHGYDLELERTESGLTMEREKAKDERERGLLSSIVPDKEGNLYGITKGVEKKALGIAGAPETTGKSGSGTGGGGLSASDASLVERVSDKYWGKKDAEGQFIIPEDARDNYALTNTRAEELALAGVPVLKASYIAAMSISGPLSEDKARELADREAHEQFGGWTQGEERRKYIESRVPELMRDSRTAEREYRRLVGGGTTGSAPRTNQAPAAAAQPQQAQGGQKASQGIPRPTSRADYDKLPSGTRFYDPQGNLRIKP